MAKNKGFDGTQSKNNGWAQGANNDPIFDAIQVATIDYDTLEKEAKSTEELLELESKKMLKHQQQENMGYIMDMDYYSNIYFICQEDRDLFFEKLGVGDMVGGFIDGYELAKRLGINIPKKLIHLPKPKSLKI